MPRPSLPISADRMIPFLLSLVLFLALPGYSQKEGADQSVSESAAETTETATESKASPTDGEKASPAKKVIPFEEVASRAQNVLEVIITTGGETKRPVIFDTIAKDMPLIMIELGEVATEVDSIRTSGRVGRRLQRIDDDLSATHRKLNTWSKDLIDLTREYQDGISSLNDALELWSNTRESITNQEGSETLIETVDTVISSIQVAKDQRMAARAEAVQVQTEVSTAATQLTAIRQLRSELSKESRHQIFLPDSPTIWDLKTFRHEEREFSAEFNQKLTNDLHDLIAYATLEPLGLILQFLIMVVTAVFLIKVRQRHQETLEQNPRTKSAAKLLNHPIATGLVIALVLTPILVRTPPLVLYRFAVFAVLIPVFLLLKTTLPDRAKRPAYTIIIFYVILKISEHLPEFSIGQRLICLALAIAGIVVSVLRVRRHRSLPSDTANSFPFEHVAAGLGVLVYSASALTNSFGIFALTQRILAGYIGALTLALILIAGINAIREFLRISMVVSPLRHLSAVRYHYTTVDLTAFRILRLAALCLFVITVLLMFNLYEPTKRLLLAILDFGWQIGALNLSIGSVIMFVFVIWVSVLISRSVRFVVNADILPRFDLPRGIPSTISMMLNYSIITLGILIAMGAAGIDLSQLSLIIGALGVGIGFGLQNLVNNFVSGLILIFERPIKVGDKIQFGTNLGEVRSIGIRASNVRTFDGAEIIVPNGNLISNEVTNWTLSDQQRRMDVVVGVAYGNDPERVLEVLGSVLGQFEDVLKDPKPFISFDGFGDSSLDFTIRFWTNDFAIGLRLKSKVSIAIYKALNEAGIEIPFPQRDLHLRSIDDAAAKRLP